MAPGQARPEGSGCAIACTPPASSHDRPPANLDPGRSNCATADGSWGVRNPKPPARRRRSTRSEAKTTRMPTAVAPLKTQTTQPPTAVTPVRRQDHPTADGGHLGRAPGPPSRRRRSARLDFKTTHLPSAIGGRIPKSTRLPASHPRNWVRPTPTAGFPTPELGLIPSDCPRRSPRFSNSVPVRAGQVPKTASMPPHKPMDDPQGGRRPPPT